MTRHAGPATFIDQLISRRTNVIVLLGLTVILLPASLFGFQNTFLVQIANGAMIILGVLLLLCTAKRITRLSGAVLMLHAGLMIIIVGRIIGATGYIATVNLYEDSTIDQFFRWDTQTEDQLGFSLRVNRIEKQYYPSEVRIGILKDEKKVRLVESRTGESFSQDDYTIRVGALDPQARRLDFEISDQDNRSLGTYRTGDDRLDIQSFPYELVLVAFKTPRLKTTTIHLSLFHGDQRIAQGTTAVNSPFSWNGINFYHTQSGSDEQGRPFVGLQIVKDPGIAVVYCGFLLFFGGCLWLLRQKS